MSPSYLFNVCEVSRSMDKWFAPDAVRLSPGSEEPRGHSTDCYLCFTVIIGSTSKSKHRDLASAMRPVPHSEELPVPKPPENLTSSDDNSDSDQDYEQQERGQSWLRSDI
jgi:hypothetical protein